MQQPLTTQLLQDLKTQGYLSLIAEGAPVEENGKFTQLLMPSHEPVRKEETAEIAYQFPTDNDSFLKATGVQYLVDMDAMK